MTEITYKQLANKNLEKANHFRELFLPFSIGFDDFFDRLNATAETHQSSGFPPYNVIRDEGKTYVELALAGYKRSNLEVVVQDGVLSISGKKEPACASDHATILEGGTRSYRGIANRNFIKKFSLGEYVEVNAAEFKDGMLVIELEEVLPPDKKARHINIV